MSEQLSRQAVSDNPSLEAVEKELKERYFLVPKATFKAYAWATTAAIAVCFGGGWKAALDKAKEYADERINEKIGADTVARIEAAMQKSEADVKVIAECEATALASSERILALEDRVKGEHALNILKALSDVVVRLAFIDNALCEELVRHEVAHKDTFWTERDDRYLGVKEVAAGAKVDAEDVGKRCVDLLGGVAK